MVSPNQSHQLSKQIIDLQTLKAANSLVDQILLSFMSTLPETNSEFSPENQWLEDELTFKNKSQYMNYTPKTNIAPEKWWLGDSFPFGMTYFQRRTVRFVECKSLRAVNFSRMTQPCTSRRSYLLSFGISLDIQSYLLRFGMFLGVQSYQTNLSFGGTGCLGFYRYLLGFAGSV